MNRPGKPPLFETPLGFKPIEGMEPETPAVPEGQGFPPSVLGPGGSEHSYWGNAGASLG